MSAPTALLHLAAQVDSDPGTAPIKLIKGPPLDDVEDGAIEYVDTGVDDLTMTVGSDRYILAKSHTGNATLDFGALGVLGSESLPVTVTGAVQGDQCVVSDNDTHIDGVIYTCAITGANVARVTALNANIVGNNPASSNFNVRAFH